MLTKFTYSTAAYGQAVIEPTREGRWRVLLGGQDLGHFRSPRAAFAAFINGSVLAHTRCPDTSRIGLPMSLCGWTRIKVSLEPTTPHLTHERLISSPCARG